MNDVVTDRTAPTATPIHDVLQQRWSPRAFEPIAIDEALLTNALEAARWTPSAYNAQPWRFIIGRRGTESFDTIAAALTGFNTTWAPNASALIVAVAELQDAEGKDQPWAVYDLGQSVAHFSVQATADGLFLHQMAGFDQDAVRREFSLDARFSPVTVLALGSVADADTLAPELRERELAPRIRKSVDELILA